MAGQQPPMTHLCSANSARQSSNVQLRHGIKTRRGGFHQTGAAAFGEVRRWLNPAAAAARVRLGVLPGNFLASMRLGTAMHWPSGGDRAHHRRILASRGVVGRLSAACCPSDWPLHLQLETALNLCDCSLPARSTLTEGSYHCRLVGGAAAAEHTAYLPP